MKYKLIIFTIFLVHNLQSFSQFLDPKKCKIVNINNEYYSKMKFCKVETDSTFKIYQIHEVVLIDTNMKRIFNEDTEDVKFKDTMIDIINAYLIDGIFQEHYKNGILKSEGILSSSYDFDMRIMDKDTLNISHINSWVLNKNMIEDIEYRELFKLGKWTNYYINGKIQSTGEYAVISNQEIIYSDDICTGGERAFTIYKTRNAKLGIWEKFDDSGYPLGKYIETWDKDNKEWKENKIE